MEKDISTLINEYRAQIDAWVEELLTFENSDLDREGLRDDAWGPRYRPLRENLQAQLDEIRVHTGQIQGARVNVAYRRLFGSDLVPSLRIARRTWSL